MAFGAHVQSSGVDSGNGTSAALAFASNNTANNTIIVVARIGGASQNPGISDSIGNTYVVVENYENSAGDTHVCWYATNIVAGANTCTLTNASSGTRRWIILEYEGKMLLDQHTHGTATGTAPDSGNVTTVVATELIFGSAVVSGSVSFTAGSNFTERQEISTKISCEDRVVTSTGTYNATFTLGASDPWSCLVATFFQDMNTSSYFLRMNHPYNFGHRPAPFAPGVPR